MTAKKEAARFDAALRQVLSVSPEELKRREEAWKRENAGKPKRGPKPKASAAKSRRDKQPK